jgi:hypothetical protein
VTLKAQLGLFLAQQRLFTPRTVWRMAGGAPDVSSGVSGPQEIPLLLLGRVAHKTAPGGFFTTQALKTHDLGNVSTTFDVSFARTVASFASLVLWNRFLVQHR